MRTKARDDVDGNHTPQKRKFDQHLTPSDQDALGASMVGAARAVFKAQANVVGGGGVVRHDLLDGI